MKGLPERVVLNAELLAAFAALKGHLLAYVEAADAVAVVNQPLRFEKQLPSIYGEDGKGFLPVEKIRFVVDLDGGDCCRDCPVK